MGASPGNVRHCTSELISMLAINGNYLPAEFLPDGLYIITAITIY